VPFLHITTHIAGREGDGLLDDKGGRGFPYIVFMDDEGQVIAVQPGRERTVEGFQKTLAGDVKRFMDLRAKALSGDAAAQIDFALLKGELGWVPFEDLKKQLDGKELSDAQRQQLRALEANALLAEVAKELAAAKSDDGFVAPAKRIVDAYAQGLLPSGPERQQQYLSIVFSYALFQKDAALAKKALDALTPVLKQMVGDDPRLAAWIRDQEDKIAALNDAGAADDEGIDEGSGEGK
jgi:hypothetical protein